MKQAKSRLDDLKMIVEGLQGSMERYGDKLADSELLTRYILVDPFLRGLGWETDDPEKVWVEHEVDGISKKRADYALFKRERIIAFVEAKKFGTCSSGRKLSKAALQVKDYAKPRKVDLAIVTDGGGWYVYDLSKRGSIKSRVILEIDFEWESLEVARAGSRLRPTHIESLLSLD